MQLEQRTVTGDAVVDAVGAEGVPHGRRVDRDDRLAQLLLELGRDGDALQVRAALDQRVDVGPVDGQEGRAQGLGGLVGDRRSRLRAQAVDRGDVEAELGEVVDDLLVADGPVRLTMPIRFAPKALSASPAAVAPVATSRPVSSRTFCSKAALPCTPPQKVSADMTITT